MNTRSLIIIALLLCVACSDNSNNNSNTGSGSYGLGDFTVVVTPTSLVISRASDSTVLLRSATAHGTAAAAESLPGLVGWRKVAKKDLDIKTAYGMSIFDETAPKWTRAPGMQVTQASNKKLVIKVGEAIMTLSPRAAGLLAVSLATPAGTSNRAVQSFACGASDRFYGMGALVHGTQHRGEVIPTWTSEQGIGKARRKFPTDGFPLIGDIHDSYFPVPFVMHSSGFGVLGENSHRNLFHLCDSGNSGRWALETWTGTLKYLVVDGPTMPKVLERLTSVTGRPRLLPKWSMAPWIDIIHGSKTVLAGAKTLRKEKVPSSAIWSEDWIGGKKEAGGYHLHYKWTHDKTLYPDLKGMIASLHAMGFRFLGYFNQFIDKNYEHWKQGEQKDTLVKDKDGKLLSFMGVFSQPTALPDFTLKAAADWYKEYAKKALDMGQDGWMADYGEWLPVEAKMSDGKSGEEAHNLYPVLWHKVNREILDKERPDGDYIFFVRSGYTGTAGQAPVVWAGDQQTEFGGLDGMASVIPIMVNGGMSGVPVMTHDIGGYSSQKVPHRTKELFYRWTALGAFSPIMRTHHGADAKDNWQWNQDAATIKYFGKMARTHVALFPYRYTLAKEAADKGMPMVRHLVLHHGKDPKVSDIKDQFMLGPSLLVAPVQQDKATSRKVYLPAGEYWREYFSDKTYTGGQEYTVPATLEQIPVFVPNGAIIPYLREQVDTLDGEATDKTVKGLKTAEEGELGVRVYLGRDSAFTMYDGAKFKLTNSKVSHGELVLELDGKALSACTAGQTTPCTQKPGLNQAMTRIRLRSVQHATLKEPGRFTIKVSGLTKAREVTLDIYY